MKDEKKRTVTPKLRFPEFRDHPGWSGAQLGSVLTEHKLQSDGNSEVHSVSLTKGVVPQVEHMGRSFSAADTSHYNLARPHDIIYTKSPLAIFKLGIVKQNRNPHNALVSPLYGVFSPANQYVGRLIEAYFDSPSRSLTYLEPLAQKGAKNTIQISNERFLSGHLYLPREEAEQQKIAECLTSLDELIAAHERKLRALRIHKKGLMQRLFPQEARASPQLRFPEFRDAPEWSTKALGDLFETATGGTPERAVEAYWGGSIPWITTSLVDGTVIWEAEQFITGQGLKNSGAKLFAAGTVLIALYGQGKTRGKAALLGIEATTNQACAAVIRSELIDPKFTFLNLAGRYEEIRALSNGGGQENLSQGLVRALPFSYPDDPAEQEKVVGCLSSLDDLIGAVVDNVAALKTHKKGMMQKLFPSPERV
jgi:type I restriction enzyme, S subunit